MRNVNSPSWSCIDNYYDDDPPFHCCGYPPPPLKMTNFSCFVHCIRHRNLSFRVMFCLFIRFIYSWRLSFIPLYCVYLTIHSMRALTSLPCIFSCWHVSIFSIVCVILDFNSHYFGLLDQWYPKVCRTHKNAKPRFFSPSFASIRNTVHKWNEMKYNELSIKSHCAALNSPPLNHILRS